MATKQLQRPEEAVGKRTNIGSAAVSRNPKAALSSVPFLVHFCHTGKRLHLGKSDYTNDFYRVIPNGGRFASLNGHPSVNCDSKID